MSDAIKRSRFFLINNVLKAVQFGRLFVLLSFKGVVFLIFVSLDIWREIFTYFVDHSLKNCAIE